MRQARIHRKTNETEIRIALTLNGHGRARIGSGIRVLDHMLELVARHGAFDLDLKARGDLDVDQHHTVEDVGIALGEAFALVFAIDARGGRVAIHGWKTITEIEPSAMMQQLQPFCSAFL